MNKFLLAATAATVALGTTSAANAAATFAFIPFGSASGLDILEDFDGPATLSYTLAGGALIKSAPSDSDGATLPNSNPTGTDYLSVVKDSSAEFTFASALNGFAFEWGSVDAYNTLTVYYVGGSVVLTGSDLTDPANGNQIAPGTNGLFMATGEMFTGFKLESSENSFEIDNVAWVPEPASWAMMIAGIAAVGFSLRRRSQNVRVAFS
jgi:hypothetical protein